MPGCTIVVDIPFEAAHRLPNVPPTHKCFRMHGHSYVCEVHVTGPIGDHTGWVCDYSEIRAAFEPLRMQLDHHCLNEIAGLANPTSENISRWIWQHLKPNLPMLTRIVLHETVYARCVFEGEN